MKVMIAARVTIDFQQIGLKKAQVTWNLSISMVRFSHLYVQFLHYEGGKKGYFYRFSRFPPAQKT